MKIKKFSDLWIIILSLFWTLVSSLDLLIHHFFKKLPREHVNKVGKTWSRRLLRVVKATYTSYNVENVHYEPNRSYVIMSNHASLYDIPLVMNALPGNIRMMAKKELFKVPVWGTAMAKSEFLSMDRSHPRQAIKDLRRAKEKMETGIVIWIAPEGTRSRKGGLQPLKKGGFQIALQTHAIIIPVGIRGTRNILPADALSFKKHQKLELHVGTPIDTKDFTRDNQQALMDQVEKQLLELSNLEKVE